MSNEQGDPLEELLKMKEPYINDEGFTQRVLGALPPPRRRFKYRRVVLVTFALVACVIAFVLFPGVQHVTQALIDVATFKPLASKIPIASFFVIAMLVGGALVAVWSEG
jgi:hypothetical protein